jgi:hypothetical protein
MRKPTGVVLSNATIDELLDYPDALTCLVGLVRHHPVRSGWTWTRPWCGRWARAWARSGLMWRSACFEWPQGVTLVPPEVAAQAGPAARARGPLQ